MMHLFFNIYFVNNAGCDNGGKYKIMKHELFSFCLGKVKLFSPDFDGLSPQNPSLLVFPGH